VTLSSRVRSSPALRRAAFGVSCARAALRSGTAFDLALAVAHFSDWSTSLDPGHDPLTDERPWITFPALRFLEKVVHGGMSVFEFGSGGSTVFFTRRARRVVAVEHDARWREVVVARLAALRLRTAEIHLRPPEPATPGEVGDPDAYLSDLPGSFRSYARAIDEYPEQSFDLVLVDGRSRPSCVKHACPRVAPGGFLLLDNSERAGYARAHQMMEDRGWARTDLAGPGPYNLYFWNSTVWRRPS
jgi:hypothetical protein